MKCDFINNILQALYTFEKIFIYLFIDLIYLFIYLLTLGYKNRVNLFTFYLYFRKEANLQLEGNFLIRNIYNDADTYNVVGAASKILSKFESVSVCTWQQLLPNYRPDNCDPSILRYLLYSHVVRQKTDGINCWHYFFIWIVWKCILPDVFWV